MSSKTTPVEQNLSPDQDGIVGPPEGETAITPEVLAANTTKPKRAAAKKSAAPKTAAKTAAKKSAPKSSTAKKSAAKPKAEPKPKPEAFAWPKDAREVLVDYLTERVSTERNAPNEGRPFINANGIIRIKPSDWREWLDAKKIAAPKIEAGRPLRELGFVMKPYALPGEGRSFGFYTAPIPTTPKWLGDKLGKLPVREVERAAAQPRNPFAKLTDSQIGVLKSALANFKGNAAAKATRDELAAMVDEAAQAQIAAAVAADAAK